MFVVKSDFFNVSIMDLISIIVPVYNVEQYLRDCIESIINQSYTKFANYLSR